MGEQSKKGQGKIGLSGRDGGGGGDLRVCVCVCRKGNWGSAVGCMDKGGVNI